jgi:hypothetical protein
MDMGHPTEGDFRTWALPGTVYGTPIYKLFSVAAGSICEATMEQSW